MAEKLLEKVKFKTVEEKPCEVTYSVQVPPEVVQHHEKDVADNIQRNALLPGFRQGKAPMNVVLQKFSDDIKSEALKKLLTDTCTMILEKECGEPCRRSDGAESGIRQRHLH